MLLCLVSTVLNITAIIIQQKEGIFCISATFRVKPQLELILAEKRAALAERLNLSSVCLHLPRGLLLTGMTKASQL